LHLKSLKKEREANIFLKERSGASPEGLEPHTLLRKEATANGNGFVFKSEENGKTATPKIS